MENQKPINAIESYMQKEAVSTGNAINPMMVQPASNARLIQIHNFRRYFQFSRAGFNPTKVGYETKNHTELHIRNYNGCYIIIRKNLAEVINGWHNKQFTAVCLNSEKEIDAKIDEICNTLESQCKAAIGKLIVEAGGSSDLVPIARRKPEIGIFGDKLLDRIPKEYIIHDDSFKKVYPDKVEILGIDEVKNQIKNSTLKSYSPEISNAIGDLGRRLDAMNEKLIPSIEKLGQNMETHVDIMKEIRDGKKEENMLLRKLNSMLSKLNARLSQRTLGGYA